MSTSSRSLSRRMKNARGAKPSQPPGKQKSDACQKSDLKEWVDLQSHGRLAQATQENTTLTANRWMRTTIKAGPANEPLRLMGVEMDVKIDGSVKVGGFPRLFVTTPDGKRREIRRMEFFPEGDKKYSPWESERVDEAAP